MRERERTQKGMEREEGRERREREEEERGDMADSVEDKAAQLKYDRVSAGLKS